MINKDKIVFNTKTYYTCSWCGAIGVKILKLFDDGCVLVQAVKILLLDRFSMFITNMNMPEEAVEIGNILNDKEKRKRNLQRKKGNLTLNSVLVIRTDGEWL